MSGGGVLVYDRLEGVRLVFLGDLKANSGINGLIRQGEGCGAGAGCQKEE